MEVNVIETLTGRTKNDVLLELAEYVVQQQIGQDVTAVYEGFLERERESSTGLMDGFAIPHVKSSAIQKASVVYGELKEATEWETFDDQPVKYVFALLVPMSEAGTLHIKMLSQLATALMDEEFKEKIKEANEPEETKKVIAQYMVVDDTVSSNG